MENLKEVILRQRPEDLIRDAIVASYGIYQPGDPQEKPLKRLLDEIAKTPVEPDPNLVLVGWYGWYPDECQSGTRLPGVEVGLFRSSALLLSLQRIPEWDRIDTVLDNQNMEPGQVAFEHLRYEDIEKLGVYHCSVCEQPWPRELEITLSAFVAPGVDSMIGEALSRMLSSQMRPQKKQWREWEQEQFEALFSPDSAACRSCRGSKLYTAVSRYHALKEAAEAVLAE